VFAKNGAFLAVSGVRLWLIARHAPLEAFAWAIAAEYALAGVALLSVYARSEPGRVTRWRLHASVAWPLLRASWPLILSGLVIAVYTRIDQVMLAAMSGDAVVGTYSVAVRLAEAWYFIPVVVASSTLPTLLRSRARDSREFSDRMQRLLNSMVLVGYVTAIPMTFLARPLVLALYGPAYADGVTSLVILSWAGVFVALGVARENWMLAEGLMTLSFATTAWGALVNVVLNLILIPRYGATGAAIATLAAQVVAVLLSTLLYRKTRPVFRMQWRALTTGLFGGGR
jgi:PST family polysaccharide transporter